MKWLLKRSDAMPLFWQIFAPNAVVLLAATAVLAFSPATVSAPIATTEAVTIAGGLLALLAVNFFLIRRALGPVKELTEVMRSVDLLLPGQRVSLRTRASEINELRTVFNRMLDRLEAERRQAGRRTLVAQEEERRRLARELHDELNQALAGVMLNLSAIGDRSDGAVGAELRTAQEELRAMSDEVERIVNRLRPETLDDLGLMSALVVLTEDFSERTGIDVERRLHPGVPSLDPDTELVVYRVAQESLTNVALHASASKAVVELGAEGEDVRLFVEDDGVGLNGQGEGNGIRGMRERANSVSARLDLGSGRGGGTSVSLTVPAPR